MILTSPMVATYGSRLKTLFWISITNFVFPCLLSLAQLVALFTDQNAAHGVYIVLTNNFIEIIGVLLATVWASASNWAETHIQNPNDVLSSVKFRIGRRRVIPYHGTMTTTVTVTDFSREVDSFHLRDLDDHGSGMIRDMKS